MNMNRIGMKMSKSFSVSPAPLLRTRSLASTTTRPTSIHTSTTNVPTRRGFTYIDSSAGIPEPGSCPECTDDNAYWDGSTLFICTNCAHEWPVVGSADANQEDNDDVIRDVNGKTLEQGDACVLTQDLAKGKLKKGQKVKIRLGDYGDGHDCEATITGVGTYALKSKFLKKV